MVFTPIRNDNAYIGAAIQSAQGSPLAPSYYFRWLDGTGIEPDLKTEELWEGDGSRNLSQIFKSGQKWKIKLLYAPRPDNLAFMEKLSCGTGADSYTAPFTATVATTAITGGTSTQSQLSTVSGLGSSGTVALMFDKGLATEEVAIMNLPASGNILTVASTYNGGKFVSNHSIGGAVQAAAVHVMTPQVDSQYSTWEVCIGDLNGAAGETFRISDCKVNSIKRHSEKGKILYYEAEVDGIACALQSSPSTPVFENRQIFLYQQSTFTLDGSTTGDALGVEKFAIEQKNALDDAIQTNSLLLSAIIFGNFELKVTLDLVAQNLQIVKKTYLGSATGTSDAQAVFSGSFTVIFKQADGLHSVQYVIPTIIYVQAKPPSPKKDGKHYSISVQSTATSNMGQNAALLTTTINNVVNAAY